MTDNSNHNTAGSFNDTVEEGEIRDDDVNVPCDLCYDSVSSDSFSASNNSFRKGRFSSRKESLSPILDRNEVQLADNSRKRTTDKSGRVRDISPDRHRSKLPSPGRSHYLKNRKDNVSGKDLQGIVLKNSVHRVKVPHGQSELNSSKSADIFVNDRHSRGCNSAISGKLKVFSF